MRRIQIVFGRFGEAHHAPDHMAFQATWNGEVVSESERTVLIEGNRYFPPEDVKFDHLEKSSRQSVCPWKGTASHFDVVADGERNVDGAWWYPNPTSAAAEIENHVAFWHGVDVSSAPPG